jgi:hypothetical protein
MPRRATISSLIFLTGAGFPMCAVLVFSSRNGGLTLPPPAAAEAAAGS